MCDPKPIRCAKLNRMGLADLTDPQSGLRAVHEFDDVGRVAFLRKYGFGRSRSYFLIADGKSTIRKPSRVPLTVTSTRRPAL